KSRFVARLVIAAGVVAILFCATISLADSGQISPKLHSVLATANVQSKPPQITLRWPVDPAATSYALARKEPDRKTSIPLTQLPGAADSYSDTGVVSGAAYEYQLIKTTPKYIGYGYLRAGIEVPLRDRRGTLVLIVANTYAADLANDLAQLQQDLVTDG